MSHQVNPSRLYLNVPDCLAAFNQLGIEPETVAWGWKVPIPDYPFPLHVDLVHDQLSFRRVQHDPAVVVAFQREHPDMTLGPTPQTRRAEQFRDRFLLAVQVAAAARCLAPLGWELVTADAHGDITFQRKTL